MILTFLYLFKKIINFFESSEFDKKLLSIFFTIFFKKKFSVNLEANGNGIVFFKTYTL